GYEFLMQHYITGDKICILGSLEAHILHAVGLLPADNFQQVPFAYKMYTRADAIGWEQSTEFKKTFAVDVPIEFIGVWDTVDSVGIIPKSLPFTTSNTITEAESVTQDFHGKYAKYTPNLKLSRSGSIPKEDQDDRVLNTYERLYSEKASGRRILRKYGLRYVTFNDGCHCDVGGGSVSNKTRHSLARITLRWIVRECFKTKTGILFNSAALRDIGLDPCTLYPTVTPRPPPLSAASHAIRIPPARPIPIRPHAFLKKKSSLIRSSNMGQARFIPKQKSNGLKVHRSVKMRMEAEYEDEPNADETKGLSSQSIFYQQSTRFFYVMGNCLHL
ncbi:hypothetical protein BJ912DRAFT_928707, partial [Pholiota molesta]